MAKPKTPPSVYVVRLAADIIKVGYSAERRWRDLARRNNGDVIGVWHFPTGLDALQAESAALAIASRHGGDTDPNRLADRAGYAECVTTTDGQALIEEVVAYLQRQEIATQCPDTHWCGTHLTPCSKHPAKHQTSITPSISQAMHVRTDGRTNEESGSVTLKLTTESRASSGKESTNCLDCGERQARARGVCNRCYQRRLSNGTVAELPRVNHRHDVETCGICDEVASLHGYGWSAEAIVTAIGRHPEHIDRHLRRWAPHLRHITVDAARAERAARKAKT